MKSLNVNPVLFFISMLFILFSCNPDPGDSLGDTTLKEIVSNESSGKIVVNSFTKTNGLKREVMGLPIYTMEFTAQIKFEQSCWKGWEPIEWMFSNFTVMDKKPTRNNMYIILQNKKFYKEATVNIEGEINFEKTEKGWRKTEYKILKANILSNPNPADKFIGTWVPVSSEIFGRYIIEKKTEGANEYFEINDGYGLFYAIAEEENGELKYKYQMDSNEWHYGGLMQLINNGQTLVDVGKNGEKTEFKKE